MAADTLTIPIFPLPNCVFFPHTLLPLHVFEPRYKEMIADALGGSRMLGVVQLRPGWEKDYHGSPPVYRVLGVGRIIGHKRWSDGRYDIIVSGRHRVRILNETRQGDYRVAETEILTDFIPEDRREEVEAEFQRHLKTFRHVVSAFPEAVEMIRPESWQDPTPGVLADVLATTFIESPYDRQSILSELDVARRLRLVSIQLNPLLKQG